MRRMVRWGVLLGLLATAGVPAAAHAERYTIGSDLSAAATLSNPHPVDTAFWPTSLASGAQFTSPVKGQAIIVRLKGSIAPVPGGAKPFDLIHFQTLRPQSDGSMKVIVSSEDDYHLPVGGDPNQVNTWTSSFLCVEKGDVIAFANSGGYDFNGYPNGVTYQVFGSVPGSSVAFFTGEHQDLNGDVFRCTSIPGQELLMQVVVGTGGDARPFCGGTSTHPNPGAFPPASDGGSGGGGGGGGGTTPGGTAKVPKQKLRVRKGRMKVKVSCAGGPCSDTLLVSYKGDKVASRRFKLSSGASATYTLKLTKFGRKLLRKNHGRSTVKLAAGGPSVRIIMRRA
jgi:hypothetical protein